MHEQMNSDTNELKQSYTDLSQKEAKARNLITELSSVSETYISLVLILQCKTFFIYFIKEN